MAFWHRHKKDADENADARPVSENQQPAKKHVRQTRKKKKSLIASMKLSQSVPSTISDALSGDNSVLESGSHSDNDYLVRNPVKYQGHTQYPVLILDDDSLNDAGLGQWGQREAKGMLSRGLKTTNGDTGFIPVATTQSLEQGYIGLLPSYDAFEVLQELKVINDYDQGWEVGLVYVSDDDLHITRTGKRLLFDDWWKLIQRQAEIYVTPQGEIALGHDNKSVEDETKVTTDELIGGAGNSNDQANGQPKVGSNHADGYSMDDLDQMDSDSATSDSIDDFLNDDSTTAADLPDDLDEEAPQDNNKGNANDQSTDGVKEQKSDAVEDANPDNGFSLDEADEELSEEDASQSSSVATTQAATKPAFQGQSQAPAPTQGQFQTPTSKQSSATAQPSQTATKVSSHTTSIGSSNDAAQKRISNISSQDQLDAQNLTVSSDQRQANDLQVSMSPDAYIRDFVDSLTFVPFQMEDDHGDPESEEAYLNRLKKHANEQGYQALQAVKADMRSQISEGINGVLTSLTSRLIGAGSKTPYSKRLNDLTAQMSDLPSLRQQADEETQAEQQKVQEQLDADKETRRRELRAQLDQEFQDRQHDVKTKQEQIINQAVAEMQQQLASQLEGVRREERQDAEAIASEAYNKLGHELAKGHRIALDYLQKIHDKQVEDLNRASESQRDKELRRLSEKASVIAHDKQIDNLNAEIESWKEKHDRDIAALEDQHKQEAQVQAQNAQKALQDAVNEQIKKTNEVQKELDNERAHQEEVRKLHKKELKRLSDSAKNSMADIKADNEQLREDNDRLTRGNRFGKLVSGIGYTLFGAATSAAITLSLVGLHGGFVQSHNTNNANTNSQPNERVIYVPTPSSNNSNSNNHKSSNSSSSNSHSESNTNDNNQSHNQSNESFQR